MQVARSVVKGGVGLAVVTLALAACSRSERQEVRQEAKQATSAVAGAIDNAALTTKVKAALLADELVKGTQINVESDNGVVTLIGSVDSAAHKDRAAQIAGGVSGVTRVQNNLTAGAAATPPPTTAPVTSTTEPPPAAVPAPPTVTARSSVIEKNPMEKAATASMTADSATVRQVQQQLIDRGYKPGAVDGIMGPNTRAALQNFKQKEGIKSSGLDDATLKALGVPQAVKP